MTMRTVAEGALRAVALGALGLVLWRWMHPAPPTTPAPEIVASGALGDALARWTDGPAAAGHAALDSLPDPVARDWLRALRGAGMRVTWSATRAPAIAAAAWPVVDPAGGIRVEIAAPSGATVAVGDALATSDTVRARGAGGAVVLPAASDAIVARGEATTARLAAPTSSALGAVLVVGRAGWEAKFVAAALEERGWPVRLRVAVAPGIDVVQGPIAFDSTAAAVVVLDSGLVDAASARRLVTWTRAGGGVVLVGDAAADGGLRAVAAGDVGAPIAAVANALASAVPQRGLVLQPIVPRGDAVVLERRDGVPAVAARRIGAGRVAQVGYADTWRWRMADADDAPAAHRAWWARVVGAAARVPNARGATSDETLAAHAVSNVRSSLNDPAPLASTVAALGPSSDAPSTARRRPPTGPRPSDGALATLAGAALLAEVASRRMRGRR